MPGKGWLILTAYLAAVLAPAVLLLSGSHD